MYIENQMRPDLCCYACCSGLILQRSDTPHSHFTFCHGRFGAIFRSELKFFNVHIVSVFWTISKCFGNFMQIIMYNCWLFPTFSISYAMFIKLCFTGCLLNSLSSLHQSLHAKWLNQLTYSVKFSLYTFLLDSVNVSWINEFLPGESWLSPKTGSVRSVRSANDQLVV